MLTEAAPSFGRAARAAGILTAGRQVGALLFTGGVLLLPRYVSGRDLDPFLWAYFAQLLVSSVLNLGLERYTAREVAGNTDGRMILGGAIVGRALSAALTPLALIAVLAVVQVRLPFAGLVGVTAWTLAVQLEGVCFAALRASERAATEAAIAFGGRVAQTAALLVAAVVSGDLVTLLTVVAIAEVAVAVVALAAAGRGVGVRFGAALPYRKLALYSALELAVFAYLRTDLMIVGRLLGSSRGATYGLAYRVVDALVALATPALLVLFAFAARQAARGVGLADTRRRSQVLLPQLGVVLAAAGICLVGVLVDFLPRLDPAGPALRVLLAATPLTYLIGVEAHLLSAEDHNGRVLWTAVLALVVNVVLNIVLVNRYAMMGAAVALVATEAIQAVALTWGSSAARRGAALTLPLVASLLVVAVAANRGATAAAVVLAAALGAIALVSMRRGARTAEVR